MRSELITHGNPPLTPVIKPQRIEDIGADRSMRANMERKKSDAFKKPEFDDFDAGERYVSVISEMSSSQYQELQRRRNGDKKPDDEFGRGILDTDVE